MWLIDNAALSLEYVRCETSVEYAILSHTWEEGEEVSFQEMKDLATREKRVPSTRFEKSASGRLGMD
jgi:hypothetical protein